MATETLPPPSAAKAHSDPFFYGWRFVTSVREDGTAYQKQVPLTEWDVLHPQEDDFIVQNDNHNNICIYLKDVLRWRCRDRSDALVLQDHRIDWQTADLIPHGPDVTFFLDATLPWDGNKGTFRVRDEGARPVFVIEVTSPSTRDKDLDEKIVEYSLAEIPLYVIVDQVDDKTGRRIDLMAYHPSPEGPVRVELADKNRVWLPEVDLWLTVDGLGVACLTADGRPVGDYIAVAESLEAEKARADAAEAKMKELEAELRRLRGE